ncbi:MAG: Sua5/YciO/YrdC/YwlC family protein, partial [Desulfosudaceae bacterium]
PQRPIVLLRQRLPHVIAPGVAPQNRYFGVMLPYTPLHCLLLARGIPVLVMTSGNPSEEPIAIDNRAAVERLAGIADGFLIHNRDIYIRSDDSIVCRASGETRMLRRSRGYVPVPLFLDRSMPPILACGAELKNTVCLTRQTHAFVSQHLGDLKNLPALEYFRQTIDHMQRILDIAPQYIAHDLHPDYLSTRYALEQTAIPKIAVQNHHAHLVACLAENNLHGKVIGLALDGTGYGTDGAIWGGEAMVADRLDFRRAAHPAYVPMPGGDAAIREPWRMAISYLLDAFGEDPAQLNLPFLANRDPGRVRTIVEMTANRINAPLTSSLGRLFDAVAAIAGLRGRVTFEGQAAMELETVAADGRFPLDPGQSYPYEIRDDGSWPLQILTAPLIRAVVADLRQGASVAGISRRFHATLIFLFAEVCDRIRRETGLQRVVLSGGVFQNVLLLEGLSEILQAGGFSVFTHRQVPTNDGGICLGQAAAAAARIAGSPPAPQKTGR